MDLANFSLICLRELFPNFIMALVQPRVLAREQGAGACLQAQAVEEVTIENNLICNKSLAPTHSGHLQLAVAGEGVPKALIHSVVLQLRRPPLSVTLVWVR